MTTGPAPICYFCRHRDEWEKDGIGLTCVAFPDGIPEAVIIEGDPHFDPIKGDHGIRFEAADPDRDPRVEPSLHERTEAS